MRLCIVYCMFSRILFQRKSNYPRYKCSKLPTQMLISRIKRFINRITVKRHLLNKMKEKSILVQFRVSRLALSMNNRTRRDFAF